MGLASFGPGEVFWLVTGTKAHEMSPDPSSGSGGLVLATCPGASGVQKP